VSIAEVAAERSSASRPSTTWTARSAAARRRVRRRRTTAEMCTASPFVSTAKARAPEHRRPSTTTSNGAERSSYTPGSLRHAPSNAERPWSDVTTPPILPRRRTSTDSDLPAPFRVSSEAVVAASAPSSSLRLYRSSGYAGGALYLTTRSVVHDLSSFGFDNDTSSYWVGACSSACYLRRESVAYWSQADHFSVDVANTRRTNEETTCPSETATSPACPAGSTPGIRIPKRPHNSMATCSAGRWRTRCPLVKTGATSSVASVAAASLPSARPRRARRRCGTRTSGSTTPTGRRRKRRTPAARSWPSRST